MRASDTADGSLAAGGIYTLLCSTYGRAGISRHSAGVVTDPTHAVVPGAKAILRNINTNAERVVQTDPSGFYLFEFVILGTTVEARVREVRAR